MDHHPLWNRIAGLKPRLRAHARIYRHHYRGHPWYVLQDRAATRYYRFSAGTYQFIGLLDGNRTVDEILQSVSAHLGETAPTKADIIGLLAQMQAADALQFDQPQNIAELFARRAQQRKQRRRQRLMSPLALRFPLLDPDAFLTRALPWVRPVFGPLGLLVWFVVVSAALVLGIAHWPEIMLHWSTRALDPRNLLLLWLLYPVIKMLHEFAHAFTTKVWGGEVHEMGVMLLVLMPIPYVDASAANAFNDKRKRMLVGAAGIMVEVFLAALAMFVWLNVQPGLVRDLAFNVMLIAGASTVLFNGNPLLRFDGYYILADAIEIPNLGSRSTQYLGYLIKRYLFGLSAVRSPVTALGERGWFVVYGIAAFVYRLTITFFIALFVAGKLFIVGVVLAIWALAAQVVYPAARQLAFVWRNSATQGRRVRTTAILSCAGVMAIALLCVLPLPSWTGAEGIIRLPERSLVRAGTDGFMVRILSAEGQRVQKDEPLFELEDSLLRTRISTLEWRLLELEARQSAELLKDRVKSEILKEDIAAAKAELAEARARFDRLVVHSPTNGIFEVPQGQDFPGRFVRKGDLLGYIAEPSTVTARVVVPQTAVDLVRRRTEGVEVRLASRPGETLHATIQGEVPSATDQLPSRVLGTQGGGAIAVDSRDSEGVKSIKRIFQFDIALPPQKTAGFVGSRVYVRFNHGAEPLARRWYRQFRQLFLSRFQV